MTILRRRCARSEFEGPEILGLDRRGRSLSGFRGVTGAKLKAKGKELDGSHGVIIPATNVPDLMLRPDIVAAVKAGRFHVWAVTDVRQGIEILTGVAYPELKRRILERAAKVRSGAKGAAKPE